VTFAEELSSLLPPDLPERDACMAGTARHLELIVEANQQFNLTRIVSPREAAIKHVLDSVLPWRLFAEAPHVVDAGSGPGFPGIPLALVLPGTRFTLVEATQKKARFISEAVEALGLKNVEVFPERAEDWLKKNPAALVTARAVAPLSRAIPLFASALRQGTRFLLYKGPDGSGEIIDAAQEMKRARCAANVVEQYELPDGLGTRTIVELTKA
jgi:16S rRNA (guanine527-N7)-methyltransferase